MKPAVAVQSSKQTTHNKSGWSENGVETTNACQYQSHLRPAKLVSPLISLLQLITASQSYINIIEKTLGSSRRLITGAVAILILLTGCAGSTYAMTSSKASYVSSPQIHVSLIQQLEMQTKRSEMPAVIHRLLSRIHRTAYVFSGNTPAGWDCSGMTSWAYQQLGIDLPHSANAQGHLGQRVHQPILGDLVVFAHAGSTNFYHVGIYLGHGQILNANSYYHTTIRQSLADYAGDQIRFVRIIPNLSQG